MKTAPVEEEYKKNKQLKNEDVQSLINWVELQPHLPNISELEAILFLHCMHYSNEGAKTVLDNFFTCRTHIPEFSENKEDFGSLRKDMDVVTCYICPHKTDDNHVVAYARLNTKDTSKFNFASSLKIFAMFGDMWLYKYGTAPGHKIVLDLDNVVLGHLPKLSIMLIKKYMFYLQECIPFRLTGVHVINVVPFIDKLLALVKPFIKKELWDVLVFHTDGMDSLYEHVPKKCLPKHLGGDGLSEQGMTEQMKSELDDFADFFKEDLKRRVDESKRPGKPKDAGELFGVEGSFKKLDID